MYMLSKCQITCNKYLFPLVIILQYRLEVITGVLHYTDEVLCDIDYLSLLQVLFFFPERAIQTCRSKGLRWE